MLDIITLRHALDQIAVNALPLLATAEDVVLSRADYLRLMAIRDSLLPAGERQEPHVLAKHPY